MEPEFAKSTSSSVDGSVLERLLTNNYQRLPVVLLAMPLVAALMAWPLLPFVDERHVAVWLGLLVGLAGLGMLTRVLYFRRDRKAPLRPWILLRLLTAGSTGTAFGLFPAIYLWVPDRFDLQIFVAAVVCTSGIGALASSGVFFPSYALYVATSAIPIILRLASDKSLLGWAGTVQLSIMVVVLFGGGYLQAKAARHFHELTRAQERLVRDLEDAKDDLRRANQTLNDRVEERTRELASAIDAKHKSELQLLTAQKMDAMGRLAGGVAHDFNNVLTAIMGSASFLKGSFGLTARAEREEVEEILKGTDRAAKLTAQLLAFTRGGASEPVRMNATERLRQLAHLLRRAIGEGYHLEVLPSEGSNVVLIDPTQFDQLVMNLVLNARDASALGQTILVELDHSATLSSAALLERHPKVRLRVKDQGTGILPEHLDQIFEPFFTTKGERGTGLGLSTCFGIAQRAGGTISVESELGKGSTFTVTLPLLGEADASEAGVPSTRSAQLPLLRCALLIEDQEPVLRVVSRILSSMGANVLEARSAEEALQLFQKEEPELDLVLSDVLLPAMNGPDLLRELRELGYRGPCLLMSGYVDDALLVDRSTGARLPLIQKPFTIAELTRAVQRALGVEVEAVDERPLG
jgi:signal transduction histidine kinase/ActR/RegA family two-component response regulator